MFHSMHATKYSAGWQLAQARLPTEVKNPLSRLKKIFSVWIFFYFPALGPRTQSSGQKGSSSGGLDFEKIFLVWNIFFSWEHVLELEPSERLAVD